jgi:beta-RFAP synthase
LSFGDPTVRQFGGVGVMVDVPAVQVRIEVSPSFTVGERLAARLESLANRWAAARCLPHLPACRIEVLSAPRLHTGLGVGTQLGLSVAWGLDSFCGLPPVPIQEWAARIGRGLRSAVGTHGFLHGGLIAELGKLSHETVSPLDRRLALPDSWRFVLICPRQGEGLCGPAEGDAFARLPPVPEDVARQLRCELQERLVPAAACGDLAVFGESVYRFGHRAGLCYASLQGGAYSGERLSELVELIRRCGVAGVGQSSWGPTVFAVCRDADQAEELVDELSRRGAIDDAEVWISATNNRGAERRVWTQDGSVSRGSPAG